jgi:putative acetyltransferase
MMTIRPAATSEGDHLVAIWLRSVRATHAFLTEDDIQELLPFVRAELNDPVGLDLWVLLDDHDVPVGFAGLAGAEVAALFLDPDHRRRGGGRLLIEHAQRLHGRLSVDVNEQNPEAVRFYEAMGFEIVGRSPDDGAGRPFPILHMRQPDPVDTAMGGGTIEDGARTEPIAS